MPDEKGVRQKYLELQIASERMRQLEQQLEAVQEKHMDLEMSRESLGELGRAEKTSMLVPVSDGIFAKAELKDNKELIVNVGAGVCVKKSVEEAQKMLEESMEELKSASKEIIEALQRTAEQSQMLEKELGSMLK